MKRAILLGLSILVLSLNTFCGKDDGPTDEPKAVEIDGFSPTSGTVGTEVTINGKDFSTTETENVVTFNGTTAEVKESTSTVIKVDVPTGATTGKIKVSVGSNSATSATDFEVITAQAAPVVNGLDVTTICEKGYVTINGSNFGSDAEQAMVFIGEVQAAIQSHSATSITFEVPVGATTGEVEVRVNGQSGFSDSQLEIFIIPSIDEFSPKEGEWGSEVTLNGRFKDQGNIIKFRNKNSQLLEAEIVSESTSEIVVKVPYGARTNGLAISYDCGTLNHFEDFTVFHGKWTKVADFGGGKRRSAVAFVLDGVPYVGLGTDGTITPNKDLWSYDPVSNQWTQKNAVLPGDGHIGCSSFVIGSTAFVTQGTLIGAGTLHSEMWEYNAVADQWTANNSFASTTRSVAAAFNIGDKGYMGTGYGEGGIELNDFWEYDNGNWTQKTNVGGAQGPVRYNAVGVGLNGKGYVGTGFGLNETTTLSDFWEYNNGTWSQMADVGNGEAVARANGIAFAVGNKIYVGFGQDLNYNDLKDIWEYDPANDIWTELATFPGTARSGAVAFVLNGKAYVGTGVESDELSDFWELDLGN
ncbi:hypothetical protein F8C76_03845 [Flagellimonas olearia]|uniref:IPT/TIG domain-containing protein n=1 Tax=Flagellimonas olearia TaxID=552546 RepID=A0A6I1E461_9FLAO|nr:IPT/TIG domain-containing protein [Allomuricauda olearia]KAB7530641.1 hypothetical protein F8C76_03845 [Allomuricauda olearia]